MQMRNLILDGTLSPGDQFPSENELCEQLNVSRTVIREAKQTLIGMGLLEASGKRTYVRSDFFKAMMDSIGYGIQLEKSSLNELIEARRIIENEAAELAAQRATGELIEQLHHHLDQQKIAIEQQDIAAFIQGDLGWHTTISIATQNRVVARMASTFRSMLEVMIAAALTVPQTDEKAYSAHKRVTEAIARHDPAGASHAMNEHLSQVQESIEIHMSTQESD